MDIVRQDYPQDMNDLDRLRAEGEQPAEPRKRLPAAAWIGGALGLIVVLGGAALLTTRPGLLPALAAQPGGGPSLVLSGGPANNVSFSITPAPELPKTPPDLTGLFSRRDGNSLFVQQGSAGCVTASGEASSAPAGDGTGPGTVTTSQVGTVTITGPETGMEVEVVVGKDTKVYKDVTAMPQPGAASGDQVIQQKVEPVISLDELKAPAVVTVWGEKQGDRIKAQTILVGPMFSLALADAGTLTPGQNGMQVKTFQITFNPAPELPTAAPDAFGAFSRRDGDSLFLHQGAQGCAINVNFASVASAAGAAGTTSGPDIASGSGRVIVSSAWPAASGPDIEVVVGKDTQIYLDVTDPPDPAVDSGSIVIQQKVELVSSLDDIKAPAVVTVWGEKQGDRIIARTILIGPMAAFTTLPAAAP